MRQCEMYHDEPTESAPPLWFETLRLSLMFTCLPANFTIFIFPRWSFQLYQEAVFSEEALKALLHYLLRTRHTVEN